MKISNRWISWDNPQLDFVKDLIRAASAKVGLEICRAREFGGDPYRDIRQLTTTNRPVIFDVGANVGQSVRRFQRHFTRPIIHCFEPGTESFEKLYARTAKMPDIVLNNIALGPMSCSANFMENTSSNMSSLLKVGPDGWGNVKRTYRVKVDTLDNYCIANLVDKIDVLKVDTQGFELQVLKGGEQLMRQHRIKLILMELIFCNMYESIPEPDDIYRYLIDRGFSLVTFYQFYYQKGRAGWTDALFVNANTTPLESADIEPAETGVAR